MSHHDEELCAAIARMALAGDGIVLGLGMGFLAVRTWLKFWSHSVALKQVHDTPVTRIADLHSLVKEEDKSEKDPQKAAPGSWKLAVYNEDLVVARPSLESVAKQQSKLVIVRGKVYPRAMVQSTGTKGESDALMAQTGSEKGVFVERTQTYIHTEMNSLLGWITQKDLVRLTQKMCLYNEWRGIFGWECEWKGLLGWGSLKEQVTISRRKVPFVMTGSSSHEDSTNLQVYVHIQLDDPPRQPLPLVTVYHKMDPVPATSHPFLHAMFGRRYPIGLLDEEKILPIGKEITAVGILSTSSDGNPMLRACKQLPCFLSEGTHEQLVAELATVTKVLLWTGIAVSTVTTIILSYAFVKNWTKWKARQRERQRREEEARQDGILVEYDLEDVTNLPDGELCVVCLLRRRRAAFIFCGHRVCCVSCAQRIERGVSARCPVCRQSVTGYVRVFDS
ncbi:unnamed protein product [Calypogeia fissa]